LYYHKERNVNVNVNIKASRILKKTFLPPQYTTSSYPIKTEAGLSNNKHDNKTTVHVNAGKLIDRYVSSNIIPGY
jgi:hypothetical protein